MNIIETNLPGVLVIEPKVFKDSRGFFMETFRDANYHDVTQGLNFLQDNHSHSVKGVLRGLHYQLNHPQGKLVFVTRGAVYDVAVDIRRGSPTFGKSFGIELNSDNHTQLYVPPGYAHGFCVLSDEVDYMYKCTNVYHPEDELGIFWNDPALKLNWPTQDFILSAKDEKHPLLADAPTDCLPVYKPAHD